MPEGLRRLGPDDADDITDLLAGIKEFDRGDRDREKSKKQLLSNMQHGSIYCGVLDDGRLVSVASTSAANSRSAMVVGVATQPGCRGRGYASAVVSSVCTASFAEGKEFLCLFYDNPNAGRIYNRIGFREIGEYAMLR
jgi:predicted GNAT family acetyltransferase